MTVAAAYAATQRVEDVLCVQAGDSEGQEGSDSHAAPHYWARLVKGTALDKNDKKAMHSLLQVRPCLHSTLLCGAAMRRTLPHSFKRFRFPLSPTLSPYSQAPAPPSPFSLLIITRVGPRGVGAVQHGGALSSQRMGAGAAREKAGGGARGSTQPAPLPSARIPLTPCARWRPCSCCWPCAWLCATEPRRTPLWCRSSETQGAACGQRA